MPRPLPHEERIQFAIEALRSSQIQGIRKAADAFNVLKSTLYKRVKGGGMHEHAQVRNRKLSLTEEEALIQWIQSMDDCSMLLMIGYIWQIANLLVCKYTSSVLLNASVTSTPVLATTVSENWVRQLLNRYPQLKTKYLRKYNY